MSDKDEETLEALKQATREARECLKDFRAMIKEYNSIIEGWEEKVNKQIGETVVKGLENYHEVQKRANKEATDAIFAKFDKLYDLITTGGDHTKPSIPELIEKKVQNEAAKLRGYPPLSGC